MVCAATKHTYKVKGLTFEVDRRYRVERRIGAGGFGTVCRGYDNDSRESVAIKRIGKAFQDIESCKRALREIRLMRHFNHENILSLRDIMSPAGDSPWSDLYLVFDFMATDLHYIIHSEQTLSGAHIQWFTYQLMRGLKAIHSAGAIHRDLKPSNLLVNKNCDIKICDFGLARAAVSGDDAQLTEYVVTRWYRAPELIAQTAHYGAAVDLWASGCILAECLGRRVVSSQVYPTPRLSSSQFLP